MNLGDDLIDEAYWNRYPVVIQYSNGYGRIYMPDRNRLLPQRMRVIPGDSFQHAFTWMLHCAQRRLNL